MLQHVTVCNNHGVDGVNPISPDCPICALTKQLEDAQDTLTSVTDELVKIKSDIADQNAAKVPINKGA